MNKILLLVSIIIVASIIFTFSTVSDHFAKAKSTKKVDFTQTLMSSQDPGQGHESHQLAIILSPNPGTIYDGSLTYTASEPVQIVILHEINKDDAKGQPTWTVDGSTVYGLTLIDTGSKSGSFEFTGAAVALHSMKPDPFVTTVSVDGWIRGEPTQVFMREMETKETEPIFPLSRANVPANIPLHEGFFEGESVYYIITDTNDQDHADLITEKQHWKVELAPPLDNVPTSALGTIYMFTNGIDGNGNHGFQNEIFSSTPVKLDEYSALQAVTHVSWKIGQNPEVLDSIEKIMEAEDAGRLELEETDVVINMPQIIWPDGQMLVKEDKIISDDMPYGGGQITDIDLENMIVTFIAHRGWGPDGKTIYYIVTDATPSGPAEMMGVTSSPTSANLIVSAAAVDLFQFNNGIKGSGPLGFQAGIAASAPGDETYSPIWRIFLISWEDSNNASILENKADIDALQSEGLINVNLAKPTNKDHIVNCPFIDPFQ